VTVPRVDDFRDPKAVSNFLWAVADLLVGSPDPDVAEAVADHLQDLGSYLGRHGLPDPKAGAS
jgi:hypothetical protein